MTLSPVYIVGIGIISPLGSGLPATEKALRENNTAIGPLQLFSLLQGSDPLPVGQIDQEINPGPLPRTHHLARIAADQAMSGCNLPPDAVIVGTTTGGILTTEQLLRKKEQNKTFYKYHGLTTVAEDLGQQYHCSGPLLTVSTACSSGAVAISLALEMLRAGKAEQVLAGGVDSLCRLTYFGFHSLQLVDRDGCRPLDSNRQGMAVAEGAAMLLLTTRDPEEEPYAELLGAGLSCDAYHPAAPHPDGNGAFVAMENALKDANRLPAEIDYINLHGTGTRENDQAESKAVLNLFTVPPPLSSIKGATGHSLAAAGAIEAVIAAISVSQNLIPANTGCHEPDPALGLQPLPHPVRQEVTTVLSNSFGFGGNNGSLVIGKPRASASTSTLQKPKEQWLTIHGTGCLSGAGGQAATITRLLQGDSVGGMAPLELISENLPPRTIRRLKRLPRMALALALAAHEDSGLAHAPSAVFMGTGWGALSETYDFLDRLNESKEQFPSPTDFVGSVHNGPAGQIAIMFAATGANITTSGGDDSFAQALLAADLLIKGSDQSAFVLGADEGHTHFSPLLDPSIAADTPLADGGGAFVVSRKTEEDRCRVRVPFYASHRADDAIAALIAWTKGEGQIEEDCGLILAGIPAAVKEDGEAQLHQFLTRTGNTAPVIRYRSLTGEFASASAVAATIATSFLEHGKVPAALTKEKDLPLANKKILVLGLGKCITAMEFIRP